MLNQKIDIVFTSHGRKQPLAQLLQEVRDIILNYSLDDSTQQTCIQVNDDSDPYLLVGHRIVHRFSVSSEVRWFQGSVLDYDPANHNHTVAYDGESDVCYFNLMEDISSGDLKVVS